MLPYMHQGAETSCMFVVLPKECIQWIQNLGICTARIEHLIIVNCLLKNKYKMHVIILFTCLSQHYKAKFSRKEYNLIEVYNKYTRYSNLIIIDNIVLQFPWLYSCFVSAPKECAYVLTNSSAKQCDWLSHARPAPFPFPLFLFPGHDRCDYITS